MSILCHVAPVVPTLKIETIQIVSKSAGGFFVVSQSIVIRY